ncbi:MAG: LLM class F420-dependent oxidoreductase [Acidimicrobiia bacterium]|nr:LLM class F420-dependent oxidoreductase [Acidimicrobiia bacterium]MYC46601.1 LLM class F420-dependent oxidoreductase [Acidimicrobiia bacterium]
MQFGIKTSQQDTRWADMLAVWTEADDIDVFTSAWNFDHFYPIFSDSTGECLEGWTTLTALAQATRRIRVGSMVNGIVYRHPAVLAAMASSLDIISGGRLELGIGAGWNEEECDAYGIELGALTQRFDRFAEACEIIKGLLTQELTSFQGRYFTLSEARNNPPGIQQPHPPICIGGQGERRTLPLVAQYADHWNCPGPDLDTFRAKHAVLREACEAIGRDPAEIKTSMHLRVPDGGDPAPVAAQAAAYAEAGVDLAICYLPPPHRPTVLEPLAEALSPLAGG